jgi:signal transduction histidine kinase
MCRSIKQLRKTDAPATDEEVRAAALQFVRKVSGYRAPSKTNQPAFDLAVDEVSRATRELLINAAKHAQAESAEVEIERVGGSIVVRVRDCGVGFDPQVLAAAKGQGLGLLSVRERLAFIGGSAELASLPGDGTLATLTAPLADAASEA